MVGWSLGMAIKGKHDEASRAVIKALQVANTATARNKAKAVLRAQRAKVLKAGLGQQFANAIRQNTYPKKGYAIEPKSIVFSRNIVKRGSGDYDLWETFDEGATVQVKNGKYRAIAVRESDRRGRNPKTPKNYPEPLLFKQSVRKGGSPVLVLQSNPSVIVFILVKTTPIPKRLDVDGTFNRSMKNYPQLVEKRFQKELKKRAARL